MKKYKNYNMVYPFILIIILVLSYYFQYLSFNTTTTGSLSSFLSNYTMIYNQYSTQSNHSIHYVQINDTSFRYIIKNNNDHTNHKNNKIYLFKRFQFKRFLINVFDKVILIQNKLKRLITFKMKNDMKKNNNHNNIISKEYSRKYIQEEIINNHIETDINYIGLTKTQVQLASNAYEIVRNHSNHITLLNYSIETNFTLSSHLAFRYYESVDWADKYNDRKYIYMLFCMYISYIYRIYNVKYINNDCIYDIYFCFIKY